MNTEQERADFEAWHLELRGFRPNRDPKRPDKYFSNHTQVGWEAWQARAALQSQDLDDAIDPLQGAANWLVEAIKDCDSCDLQYQLFIGHNRAQRLLDHARRIEGDRE